jgi:hypothetical protein
VLLVLLCERYQIEEEMFAFVAAAAVKAADQSKYDGYGLLNKV